MLGLGLDRCTKWEGLVSWAYFDSEMNEAQPA